MTIVILKTRVKPRPNNADAQIGLAESEGMDRCSFDPSFVKAAAGFVEWLLWHKRALFRPFYTKGRLKKADVFREIHQKWSLMVINPLGICILISMHKIIEKSHGAMDSHDMGWP